MICLDLFLYTLICFNLFCFDFQDATFKFASTILDILKNKKLEAKEVVNEINSIKKEIDDCKEKLELKKKTIEEEEEEEDGEKILDEEEFNLIKTISELKSKYRIKYEMLQNLRSDVSYCDKIVNQCRQRLLSEFNAWYTDCFMPIDENEDKNEDRKSASSHNKEGKTVRIVEDEQEKFDRIQMELMMENPESVPFYSAKLQTERRLLYTDASKKRKPGTVTSQIRDKHPTSLTVN